MKQDYHPGCYHCPGGLGLKYPLFDDEYFWVVCDAHPLVEGHMLIITKEHTTCMAALSEDAFMKFGELYEKVLAFLNKTYSRAAVFEHGVVGQTVFHAHMHFLPFDKSINEIVPEEGSLRAISTLGEISSEFNKNQRYLFVAINNGKWLVDSKIGCPRFFRERFARALGAEARADWKKTEESAELMKAFGQEIQLLKNKWQAFFSEQKQV